MAAIDNPLLITNTDISGVLKNVYEQYRINAFPKLTVLLAQIKKASPGGPERMQWGGNGVYWDIVVDRPVGGHASQAGYFGYSSQARERQATLGIKRTYISRQVDALTIQGTANKEAAYIPVVRKIVQEAMDAAQLFQQETLHGNGRGIKALIGTVTDTTHIIVSSPYGVSGAGQGGLLLDVGMYIRVLDATDSFATILGSATITNVANSGDNATLTLDTAITGMAAGDAVVTASAQAGETSLDAVPNGLINITNRGAAYNSLHGIDASTYPRTAPLRLVAGTDTTDADQISEFDIWTLITRLANVSGKNAKTNPGEFLLLTTPGLEVALAQTFFGQRQWDMNSKVTLKGGFKAVEVCGLPMVSDPWCPAGTVYLIHLPSLTWVDRQDWVKLQYEDSGPWRFVPGRDAYEVNFGAYWNFGVLQRNAMASITGYTDTSRFTHVV